MTILAKIESGRGSVVIQSNERILITVTIGMETLKDTESEILPAGIIRKTFTKVLIVIKIYISLAAYEEFSSTPRAMKFCTQRVRKVLKSI